MVSLFDTRVKIDIDGAKDDRDSQDKLDGDAFTDSDTTLMDSMVLKDYLGSINPSTKYGNDAEPDTHLDTAMDNDRHNQTNSRISIRTKFSSATREPKRIAPPLGIQMIPVSLMRKRQIIL